MRKSLLLLWILFGATLVSEATHYMGVDINYQCIGPCRYRIYHYTYYDCNGAATTPLPGPPPAPSITFQSSPANCSPQPTALGGWQFVSYTEVTPLCPGQVTACTQPGAAINGVLGAVFYQDYTFCNSAGASSCNTWTIEWYNCCRNSTVTSGAVDDGIYSGSTIINLGITPCNSSPFFNNPPVPYISAGHVQPRVG